MLFRRISIAFSVGSFLAASSPAQQRPLHDDIQRIYNFQPHLMTDPQRAEKSGVLDQFWEKVKAGKATLLPALRGELADLTNPGFFLYDGSMLLLSLSDTPADRRLMLTAIAKCELPDVQPTDYFHQVHRISSLNEDTALAALHILDDPQFSVSVPQHALSLAQDYALVYLLLPEDPKFWLRPALDRLRVERDPTAQKSLLLLLWYAQTPETDKAISDFASDSSRPADLRARAKELLARKGPPLGSNRAMAAVRSEAAIRELRRNRMKAVSDEALYDLDDYTMQLIAKRR